MIRRNLFHNRPYFFHLWRGRYYFQIRRIKPHAPHLCLPLYSLRPANITRITLKIITCLSQKFVINYFSKNFLMGYTIFLIHWAIKLSRYLSQSIAIHNLLFSLLYLDLNFIMRWGMIGDLIVVLTNKLFDRSDNKNHWMFEV